MCVNDLMASDCDVIIDKRFLYAIKDCMDYTLRQFSLVYPPFKLVYCYPLVY